MLRAADAQGVATAKVSAGVTVGLDISPRQIGSAGECGLPHDRVINPAQFRGAVEAPEIGEPQRRFLGRRVDQNRGCRWSKPRIIRMDSRVGGVEAIRFIAGVMPAVGPLRRHHPPVNRRLGGRVDAVNGTPADVAAVRAVILGVGIGILGRCQIVGHPRVAHVVAVGPIARERMRRNCGSDPLARAADRIGGVIQAAAIAIQAATGLVDQLAIPFQLIACAGTAVGLAIEGEGRWDSDRRVTHFDFVGHGSASNHATFIGLEADRHCRKPRLAAAHGECRSGVFEVRQTDRRIRTELKTVRCFKGDLSATGHGFVGHVP